MGDIPIHTEALTMDQIYPVYLDPYFSMNRFNERCLAEMDDLTSMGTIFFPEGMMKSTP